MGDGYIAAFYDRETNFQTFYKDGKEIAVWGYPRDGSIQKHGEKITGLVKTMYPKGEGGLWSDEEFTDNELNGASCWFYKNGMIKSESVYKNGALISRKEYEIPAERGSYAVTFGGYVLKDYGGKYSDEELENILAEGAGNKWDDRNCDELEGLFNASLLRLGIDGSSDFSHINFIYHHYSMEHALMGLLLRLKQINTDIYAKTIKTLESALLKFHIEYRVRNLKSLGILLRICSKLEELKTHPRIGELLLEMEQRSKEIRGYIHSKDRSANSAGSTIDEIFCGICLLPGFSRQMCKREWVEAYKNTTDKLMRIMYEFEFKKCKIRTGEYWDISAAL